MSSNKPLLGTADGLEIWADTTVPTTALPGHLHRHTLIDPGVDHTQPMPFPGRYATIMAQRDAPANVTPSYLERLAMRMGWPSTSYFNNYGRFQFITCQRLNDDVIVAFGIIDGKPFTIETPSDMFPNDAFITKLRILEG